MSAAGGERDTAGISLADVRELEQYITQLRHFLPTPMLIVTPAGVIADTTDAFTSLMGGGEGDFIGDRLVGMFVDKAQAGWLHRQTLEQGSVRNVEHLLRRPDGRSIPALCSTMVRRTKEGECIGYFACFVDITERLSLEERLRQKQKLEAIGQLAGGVAHDFNNLLGGILGFAEVLTTRLPADSPLQLYAAQIGATAEKAASLARSLVLFSRKTKMRNESLDMREVVRQVVMVLEHTLDRRIIIAQHLCESCAVTSGDPAQLETAVLNLALNARDAMPEGGELCFCVGLVQLDEASCARSPFDIVPGPYVELEVRDTGLGMDRATMERVFEPFFTTKERGTGTGLGLATVYGVVREHHGAIEVRSTPGEGAVFRLLLPQAPVPARAQPDPGVESVQHGGECVLVIDDEESVLASTRDMLEVVGYRVLTARDGQEGAQVFARRFAEIDLVILDMIMPRMDGLATFEALQAIDPGVRVVVISGHSEEGQVPALLAQGASAFQQKPFRMADLHRTVARVLRDAPP